jgi:hypothetical protein
MAGLGHKAPQEALTPKPDEVWRHYQGERVRILFLGIYLSGDVEKVVVTYQTIKDTEEATRNGPRWSRDLSEWAAFVSDKLKVRRFVREEAADGTADVRQAEAKPEEPPPYAGW